VIGLPKLRPSATGLATDTSRTECVNRDAPVCDGGSTCCQPTGRRLNGFLFAIRPWAADPMPMPPTEVVNSIQTSFDNGRMLSAICIASCETSKGRGISGEALTEPGFPIHVSLNASCAKALAGAPHDRRKRSIAMAHLTFVSRITDVSGTHLPYG
jgi:hypothetical protein